MINKKEISVGRAYGFFYCNASKLEIETTLPRIRELVETPSQLELSLIEGMDNLQGDEGLIALAQEAKEGGINYVLQAMYPGGTNRSTADELSSILNQAYQSPLYQTGESFFGEIAYGEDGEYIFKE